MNMRARISLWTGIVVLAAGALAVPNAALAGGDPTGACCLSNGDCQPATEASCTTTFSGQYQGDDVLCAAAGCIPFPSLVINEIDYDQPGTPDEAEFIELKNVSPVAIDLSVFSIELVNGSGGGATVYQTINLPAVSLAAGDYFVICANGATVANCDFDVDPDTNLIQNGIPDAVAIMHDGGVIDALSYEGLTAAPYNEGDGFSLSDPAIFRVGLSRLPDGADSDQNAVDFSRRCITPGAANTTNNTDCAFNRGACCLGDGSCIEDRTEAECGAAGGLWGGTDSTCASLDCSQIGACCRADGSCEIAFATDCQSAGETYIGDGSTCEAGTCTLGACCLPDGTCQDVSETDCDTAGGVWNGLGTDCASTNCPQPTGACCHDDGTCTVATAADCAAASGTYQGDGVTCAQANCPEPTGACCHDDGSCMVETTADCAAASGDYQGDDVTCAQANCPEPPAPSPTPNGACCMDDGSCTDGTEADCDAAGGTYQGDGTDCAAVQCPVPPVPPGPPAPPGPQPVAPTSPFCIPFLGQTLFGSPLCAPCFFAGIVGSFVGIVGMKRRLRRRRASASKRS